MPDDLPAAKPGPPPRLPLRASTLGTVYCVLSAVFYTLMGICQRQLSKDCDPVWVNCVQASVSAVVFGVYLAFRSLRGQSAWPPLAVAAGLMVVGVVTQLGGASYVWSLGVIGLAIGNPLQMGVMLAAAALLGWLLLGERVSWRGLTAIVLITASVVLLSLGAEEASEAMRAAESAETAPGSGAGESVVGVPSSDGKDKLKLGLQPDTEDKLMLELQPDDSDRAAGVGLLRVLLGVGAACFAGVAFAILTVGVRKTATESTAPEAIVFFINVMGVLFLGPWAVARLGLSGLLDTPPRDLAVMLAIGACNLIAFLLVVKALELTAVVRVNVINNSLTTVLSVAAGIAIFAEPANRELVIGILLTLVGIVLISGTEAEEAGPTAVAATSESPE